MGIGYTLDASSRKKIIHVALYLSVNANQHTKFLFPRLISFGDIVGCWSPQKPLADKFLNRALVLINAYKYTKFQLPSSISFRDNQGVPKCNVGATSLLPYPVRWNFYVCSKYLARSNGVPNFSIAALWIMKLCKYVLAISFALYVPKMGFWGGFEGEDVKILCSNPKRALPCMNMRLLVYHMSKSVQRPKL